MTTVPSELPVVWSELGVPIAVTSQQRAVGQVLEYVRSTRNGGTGVAIRLLNSYSMALARSDEKYQLALSSTGTNFPDGTPIRWIARRHGVRLGTVRGPSLFRDLLRNQSVHLKHFFIGGNAELLDNLITQVRKDLNPDVLIGGTYAPPFRALTAAESEDLDHQLDQAKPDIIWVGLGTPKQDYEVVRLVQTRSAVAIGVGAAFDFLSGNKIEAHSALHATGLEWLVRLWSEPRRLGPRYWAAAKWIANELRGGT